MSTSLPGWILWPPDVSRKSTYYASHIPGLFGQGLQEFSTKQLKLRLDADKTNKGKASKCRTDQVVRRFCSIGQKTQALFYWITVIDWEDHTKYSVYYEEVPEKWGIFVVIIITGVKDLGHSLE